MNDSVVRERPVHLIVDGATDAGRVRGENQDDFLIAELGGSGAANGFLRGGGTADGAAGAGRFDVGPKGALLVVADGMGGAAGGALASRLAVLAIFRELANRWGAERHNTPDRFACALRDAVLAANAGIHDLSNQEPSYRGMGTTVTAAGVLDGCLYLAQVGDSRAYLVRQGQAHQLTRDQSLVAALVEAGTMTEEEAERDTDRNVILQALGPEPRVEVDLSFQTLRRGDVIVLCSDGLYRVVQRVEVAAEAGLAESPTDLCARLLAIANERGGPDNITVVAAALDGPGLEEPTGDEPIGHNPFSPVSG